MTAHASLFAPQTLVDPFDHYARAHADGTAIFEIADYSAITVFPNVLLRGVTNLPIKFRRAA